jgi:transposase
MPPVYIGVPKKHYRQLEIETKGSGPVEVVASLKVNRKQLSCPHCGSNQLRSKGLYRRRAKHLSMFGKESYLTVLLRRYRCVACRRSFSPETPGLKPGRRSTEPLRQQLARLHHEGIPQSTLAGMNGISDASIERFYAEYNQRKAAERLTQQCPMVLGIDEHTLHKKQRFATTFCDLRNHKVFDVVAGKSEKELLPFLASLKGRERVKIVCIDLSSSYRSLIRKWFPNAKIVSDRFHVIRLIQHHFLALFRELVPSLADERGIFRLLRKKPKNLLPEQRLKLKALFLLHPVLKPVYDQMQKVRRLFSQKTKTKAQCRPLAHLFTRILEQLEDSLFQPMLTLAETLRSWAEPLARMWRFSKNNGITEGFHRKMKLIQRRAYGFRNFNNYRLRVVAHCG